MQTLRSILLLIALLLVFVFGLSLGVYSSHTNPDFYRQFALFRDVIPGQPLVIEDGDIAEADVPVLSDVVEVPEVVDEVVPAELEMPEVKEIVVPVDDRMICS